ncbi:MAG: uracil-DNA glycosylase [Alphaproteobacteria bacterium]
MPETVPATPAGYAPPPDCDLCPRLVDFRNKNRETWPDWHNRPVPSFGPLDASLLIVGLAPGLKGANRTGRPFTGDYAGDLLYQTLKKFDFAAGTYDKRPDDGLELRDCRIANGVRCLPPENKPIGSEVNNCRPFLVAEIAAMKNLKVILALGGIAHNTLLSTLGERRASYKFAHCAFHTLGNGLILADSYHCSRYNTNTGRLTEEMFEDVFVNIRKQL